MTLYIFYELLSLATLPLVMHGMKPKSVYAGRKYAYYTLGGAAMGFLALVAVIHFSGSSNFVAGGIPALMAAPTGLMLIFFVLGFFGFGAKAAVFPLHDWLPTAGVAPTPVTALLHAVAVVKAGAFAVIRLSHYTFGSQLLSGTWAQYLCLGVALLSILFGSAMALRERHLKRRLAYSTMSNLNYIVAGALLLTPAGLQGSLMHLVYHALMKLCLFCCVGAVMIYTGKSYVHEIRGIGRRMPITMAMFLFAGIELIGIPPFIGFQSKWYLATAALEMGPWGIGMIVVLLISAVLTCLYILAPALSAMMPLPEGATDRKAEPGWRMLLPLGLLCLMMLAFVFTSGPLVNYLGQVAQGLL